MPGAAAAGGGGPVKIVSFAWTTPPLIAGAKTFTWREWNERYARSFKAGELVAAYDKSQRNHGHQVATIRLTRAPLYVCAATLADEDYEHEGLKWMAGHPESWPKTIFGEKFTPYHVSWQHFADFRERAEWGWDIRFELVGLGGLVGPS